MIRMISYDKEVAEFETAEEMFMFQDIMVETSGDFECDMQFSDSFIYLDFVNRHNDNLEWKAGQ